jgi:hypothetical protein
MMNRPRYSVGVDPGTHTGYAVYDRERKQLVTVKELDFWGVYETFRASSPSDFDVFIEVPKTKAAFGGKMSHTRSVNIGMVYGMSHTLADGIEQIGFNVSRVTPKQKGAKVDHDYIVKLTGIEEKTNEHKRDAIMLCWGR